jgi:hypothetical protein
MGINDFKSLFSFAEIFSPLILCLLLLLIIRLVLEKLNKQKCKIMLLYSALFEVCALTNSEAGMLRIINDNRDNIEIRIIPEPASECSAYCWKCIAGTYSKNQKHEVNLAFSSGDFCGNQYFTVAGTTGGFLFNGRCRNLNVFKNYEIRFLDSFLGIDCISKEI